MEKTWFMAQWNINPMAKALRTQWNTPSQFIALLEKAWISERLFFEAVIVMVKDKKTQHKRDHANQNQFYALYEVDKSNVPSSF